MVDFANKMWQLRYDPAVDGDARAALDFHGNTILRLAEHQVSFQWKNPDFLSKNPDLLLKNPDLLLKTLIL